NTNGSVAAASASTWARTSSRSPSTRAASCPSGSSSAKLPMPPELTVEPAAVSPVAASQLLCHPRHAQLGLHHALDVLRHLRQRHAAHHLVQEAGDQHV